MNQTQTIYDTIVIGAGAAGLFYAAADESPGRKLILEKTSRPGQKLLFAGGGMCNLTHGGSIKDFTDKYGDHGGRIRGCLYKNNNIAMQKWFESHGLPLTEREDGKVFPASLKGRDVLDLLLARADRNGYALRCDTEVTGITPVDSITVTCADLSYAARKLIIACGGASYPGTGSDGSFLKVLERDLGLKTVPLHPALAPVYVQDYPYNFLSGVSFPDVIVTSGKHRTRGALLFTHKGFSGPAILHISQYVKAGDILRINYLPDRKIPEVYQQIRDDMPGNQKGIANYVANTFGLPKAFAETLFPDPTRKLSSVGHKELENVTHLMMDHAHFVSGTGGWNDAMVTTGGVDLSEMDLKTMSLKSCPGIHVIGEALDINGDTGGYNLQFAWSSAMAAK